MTTNELNTLKYSLMYYQVQHADKVANLSKIAARRDLMKEEIAKLNLLTFYIKNIMEYTLFAENETDTNFLSRDEIKQILYNINEIIGTGYYYNFIKQ